LVDLPPLSGTIAVGRPPSLRWNLNEYVTPLSAAVHLIEIALASALHGCPNRLTICANPLGRDG
jgi:hypothetical protein